MDTRKRNQRLRLSNHPIQFSFGTSEIFELTRAAGERLVNVEEQPFTEEERQFIKSRKFLKGNP